jgi:hypothetical protein
MTEYELGMHLLEQGGAMLAILWDSLSYNMRGTSTNIVVVRD